MGTCLGNCLTKTLKVSRISGSKMIQQWIDVINREFVYHHCRERFDIHARNARLPVAIARTLNVGTEGP